MADRNLSTAFRNKLESHYNDELMLIFASISHAQLASPIYVVSEDVNGVSMHNGAPINYIWNGITYLGCPFSFKFMKDSDAHPVAQISFQNIDQKVGRAVLAIQSSPMFRFTVLKLSDYNLTIDANNARSPTGTPTIEYDANYLRLTNVTGDAFQVQGDVSPVSIAGEPCPTIRTTIERTPGLFR